jgi:hypothetical protein
LYFKFETFLIFRRKFVVSITPMLVALDMELKENNQRGKCLEDTTTTLHFAITMVAYNANDSNLVGS